MGVVNPNDKITVTAHLQTGVGNTINNVFTFRYEGIGTQADEASMQDLALKLEDFYSALNSHIVDNVAYVDISGFNVTQDRPMPTVNWPTLTAGGSTSDPLPDGVSGLMLLRTGIKRVLGRKFIGGLAEGDNTAGVWESTLVAALAAAGAELIGSFLGGQTGALWLPGVIDKLGAFWSFIETFASNNPAYQRRRRPGRGI